MNVKCITGAIKIVTCELNTDKSVDGKSEIDNVVKVKKYFICLRWKC